MLCSLRRIMPGHGSQDSRRRQTGARPRGARLVLETIEERILLSSGVGGLLTAGGDVTAFTPNHIIFRPAVGIGPMATAGPTGMTPAQVRHAYGFDQISYPQIGGYNANAGLGQTIAIVDAYDDPNFVNSTDTANFINSDLHRFDAAFGLPDPPSPYFSPS